mmetsp:Transcript_9937/g.31059  ORF Transcript_9937/g.31059 Transcript_9937/m.31059 type:complete len:203 (-) Transcript_9937:1908-2516(-)
MRSARRDSREPVRTGAAAPVLLRAEETADFGLGRSFALASGSCSLASNDRSSSSLRKQPLSVLSFSSFCARAASTPRERSTRLSAQRRPNSSPHCSSVPSKPKWFEMIRISSSLRWPSPSKSQPLKTARMSSVRSPSMLLVTSISSLLLIDCNSSSEQYRPPSLLSLTSFSKDTRLRPLAGSTPRSAQRCLKSACHCSPLPS